MPKVFISYARDDVAAAQRIYQELRRVADVEPWLDRECLLPGARWRPAIKKAIRESEYFLALLSSRSVSKKGYVQAELSEALAIMKELPEDKVFVLPARLDDCAPPFEALREIQYVDLFPDWKDGLGRLVRVIVGDTNSWPGPIEGRLHPNRLAEGYDVVHLLGQGGMADVFLARRKLDGLLVALKVPRGMIGTTLTQSMLRGFEQEIRTWEILKHENIVALYEHGWQPYPWLAMELMEGGSLTTRLGNRPIAETVEVVVKICRALEFAHEAGVVHRDIKPANILFTGAGEPKIADWGLAGAPLFQSLSVSSFGTPAYSAPEQVDPASFGTYSPAGDVFQLGIVLYEALSGRHPFVLPHEELLQVSPFTVVNRIVDHQFRPATPSRLRTSIPEGLDRIILQSLERRVGERFRTVTALRTALQKWI